jgi:hypothetical protein
MKALFAVLAVLVAGIGVLFLTQATMGVGLVGLACLLAIFARIAQATDHHAALAPKPPTA